MGRSKLPLRPDHASHLAQRLVNGQLALFAGAGLSHLAPRSDGGAGRLPLWSELARRVAEICGEDPVAFQNDPLDLFDAIVYGQDRLTLEEALRQVLDDGPFAPAAAHQELRRLPWAAVLTTNYDGLLAKLYGREPVWDEQGYDRVRSAGSPEPLVFQIHGTLARPHTLTREDYRLWGEKHPRAFHHLEDVILNRTVLFAGYSLSDPHLDLLLATVRRITAGREKRLYAWMWQLPEAKARLLDRRDKIAAISLANEEEWAAAFRQLAGALGEIESKGGAKPAPVAVVDPYAYERTQYVQALESRYGIANLQGLYIWGAGYARGDVALDEVFVEPDLLCGRASAPSSRFQPPRSLQEVRQAEEDERVGIARSSGREPAGTVRDREPRLVVVGAPGQGKSSLLRRWLLVAAKAWQEQPALQPFPVYLRLAEWEARGLASGAALLQYVLDALPQLGEIGSDAIQSWISQPMLWLLDGVDEVWDPYDRELLREEVAGVAASRPQDRWVVATRPAGEPAGGFAAGWRRAELPALTNPQLLEVLTRWGRVLAAKEGLRLDASGLHRNLRRDRGLARLRGNALLVTLAVLFYKSRHRLPHDRWEFYNVAEQVLRDSWVHHRFRDAKDHLPGSYLAPLLECLALLGMEQGRVLFSREVLERECRSLLASRGYQGADEDRETAQFLRAAEDLIGVLVAQGPDSFGFLHLTFQEFLAARALQNRSAEVPGLVERFWDDRDWQEVWELYALAVQGDEARLADLCQQVLVHPHPLDEQLQRHRLACLRLCGVVTSELPEAGQETVRWAEQVLRGRRSHLGLDVLSVLAAWQRPIPVPLLRLVLAQKHIAGRKASYRDAAVKVLRESAHEPEVLRGLLDRLRDKRARVREEAIEALSLVAGTAEVSRALLPALRDKDTGVRWSAAGALSSSVGEPAVCEAMLAGIDDPDVQCRRVVVANLWLVSGDSKVQAALLARLGDDDLTVRTEAAHALGSAAAVPEVRSALLARLGDNHAKLRAAAIYGLQSVAAEPEVKAALLARLGDEQPGVRWVAVGALGPVAGEIEVRTALLARLGDADVSVRMLANMVLAKEVAELEVRTALLASLEDDSPDVRMGAARALSPVSAEPEVRTKLLSCLGDDRAEVRMTAATALSPASADSEVRKALLVRLQDDDETVRSAAASALSPVAIRSEVQKSLAARLEDADPEVRRAAAEALSSVADQPLVLEALLQRLAGAQPDDRPAVIHALARAADNARVRRALLVELDAGADPFAQRIAAQVLAQGIQAEKARARARTSRSRAVSPAPGRPPRRSPKLTARKKAQAS
ncbi:MAG TPA: HEAT repeat domain-containing protein [Thermoanaerobaculia bacterium]|nr:HEAT repeat domain-containing protein [Thermoanaerobaculia bacterium]